MSRLPQHNTRKPIDGVEGEREREREGGVRYGDDELSLSVPP